MSLPSRTSRSRLKLRTSFANCSLPCLLTLSLILLLAQLRALELTTPNVSKFKFPVELIQNNATKHQIRTATDSNRFQSATIVDAAKYLVKSNSPSIQNGTTTSQFELATDQTGELAAASESGPSLETTNSQDQLLQQAAAELVASFNQPQLPPIGQFVGQPEAQNAHTLAELTAAGTVAGLRLAQDLMAQADMVGEQSQPYAGLGTSQQQEAPIWSSAGENIEAAMAANGGNDEDEAEAPSGGGAGSWNDNGDNESGGASEGARALPEARSDAGQLKAAKNQIALADGNNSVQQQQDEADQPLDESQMPDSIESLMGADLNANADEPEEGLSQAGEQSNIDEAPDQQQPADSNNIYANNPNLLSGLNPLQQLAAASALERQSNGNDDDDDESDYQQPGRMSRMDAANSPATFRPAPVVLARNELRGRGPEMDHSNLVAPMRDSLVDLNSAAGHYYGKKKKKKKVKKVIVKKKKKKIKIKKYKLVKTKKKKKYKKHYPKKYHHKKHHGHDHGKYYMYAKVPKKKSWEFGFKKGNKKHWISRHEKGHKNKFKTKVKWFDKKSKGKGIHVWDYNHHDKKKKKHHY